jgi:hypothetical protein
LVWDREMDRISVSVKPPKWFLSDKKDDKHTKRLILSALAGIYAPVIHTSKIGLQELWKEGYQWDQDLPDSVKQRCVDWFASLESLKTVKFERCLTPLEYKGHHIIVIFCDASQNGFGSVAYFCWKKTD